MLFIHDTFLVHENFKGPPPAERGVGHYDSINGYPHLRPPTLDKPYVSQNSVYLLLADNLQQTFWLDTEAFIKSS